MTVQGLAYRQMNIIDYDLQKDQEDKGRYKLQPDKRSVYLAEKGSTALKNIIASGKKTWTKSKTYRRYDKKGGLESALADFYSFKPENVHEFRDKTDKVILLNGTAGKKRLRLRLEGDRFSLRRPVLDVIGADTNTRPYIDRIIYRE